MAVMAGVDYRPINYSGVPRMRSSGPNVVVIHTIVGNDPASAAHFSTRGDGYKTQSRDTLYQSAACYQGNPRAIAIENDDHGSEFGSWSGTDVPAFTEAQCESIAEICAWAYLTHGIPLVLVPDSKTGSAGIGYHRQGIDGNWAGYAYGGRVPGGEYWSTSYGKVCPGDRRIKQVIEIIIPRARVIAGLDPDDMDWNTKYTFGRTGYTTEYGNWMGETNFAAGEAMGATARIEATLAAMQGTISTRQAEILAAIRADEDDQSVDPLAVAVHLAPLLATYLPDVITRLSDADVERVAQEAADEIDRRSRDDDPHTGPTS